MEPDLEGTIIFNTLGVSSYAFDVFSVNLPTSSPLTHQHLTERRHTDGISVNFNAQFLDEGRSIAFVSERTGSSRIFKMTTATESPTPKPQPLPHLPESLYHDRPVIKNRRLYFVSVHEKPDRWFKSWSAVYSADLDSNRMVRLTPPGFADFSPAVSRSGNLIAVASYGSRTWEGDFNDLKTEIAVFDPSNSSERNVVCSNGGWPTFSGDSTLFFHRKAEDGWWSIFRLDLTGDGKPPDRITPPGVHAFTPSAAHNGRWIAVATRRKETKYRHIEIFNLETEEFIQVTEIINPNLHHYNPFLSPESTHLGYHRFRGDGDTTMRYITPVSSPEEHLKMIRTPMSFPSFSPDGEYIALNGDFLTTPGLTILKSDGSKKWTLMKDSAAFSTAWSPKEDGVIYTSVGPIFQPSKTTVQIAQVSFALDGEDAAVTSVKLLTRSDVGNNAFPSCSPDGKFLVFRSGRSGRKNLYILDAVNGESENGDGIRRLTEGKWTDTMPSWSPDGSLIAFSSNRHAPENRHVFGIYLIRPDGTGLRRVHVAGREGSADVDRERINHVCFSPDSKWLLFAANVGGVSGEPVSFPNHYQPYGDLYACRLDGSGVRRLTCNPFENGTPAWHARGGALGVGSMISSVGEVVGDEISGPFDEPPWLTCDV